MKKFLFLLLIILLFCVGCSKKQLDITIQIPKDVELYKTYAEIEKAKNSSEEAKTSGIETIIAPIVAETVTSFWKIRSDENSKLIRYRIIVYDNNTINGSYKMKINGQEIDFVIIKKEVEND